MNNEEIKALVTTAKQYSYQFDTYDEDVVVAQITEEFMEIIALNDEAILKRRRDYIGIGEESDYLNQMLETSEGKVLSGIRHMGGNREEPFILIWPSFCIRDMEQVVADILPHYAIFKPKSIRFWIRPGGNRYGGEIIQQRFIAKTEAIPIGNLPLYKPESYYTWYAEQYHAFHEQNKRMKDRVTVNDKELMDDCLSEGLLYMWDKDKERAGLIAGEYTTFLGEKTIYIDEILIASAYRGQGYAPQLLGSFVDKTDAVYLTCHIDKENYASTKTALKSNETVFSQECVIHI